MTSQQQSAPLEVLDLSFYNVLCFKPPSHQIANIKPGDKSLEFKCIILDKVETIEQLKSQGKITKFLVADETASGYLNIFQQKGDVFKQGDVLYINNAYAAMFKGQLILYEGFIYSKLLLIKGKIGVALKIGEFYLPYNDQINISTQNWLGMKDQII